MGVAALGLQRQRAAQRVQAEQRVRAGQQHDAGKRSLRDQIPVDDVAERLVDAHAVLEHRYALRRAEQRAGRKAAEVDVHLVRVALHLVDVDAAELAAHEVGQVQALRLAQPLVGRGLHVRRDLVARHAGAGHRRRRDHLDVRQRRRGSLHLGLRGHTERSQAGERERGSDHRKSPRVLVPDRQELASPRR
jgi:hypothetical protein